METLRNADYQATAQTYGTKVFGGGGSGRKGAGLSRRGHQELDVRLWGRAGGYGDQAGLVLEDRPPPCGKHSHGRCSRQEAQTSPGCKQVGGALSACAPTLELRGKRGVRSGLVSLLLRFQAKLHASSSSLHHPLLPPSHHSPSPLRLPGQPTSLSSTADMGTYLPSWHVLWDV